MEKYRLNPNRRYVRKYMAHDDIDANEFPDAREHFEGGIPALAKWCKKNLRRRDLEALKNEIEGELSHRLTSVIGEDRKRVKIAEQAFARDYGAGVRVLPIDTVAAPSRPTNPEAMRKAGEQLAALLGDLAPNKVL
jgi:hypothetical protein